MRNLEGNLIYNAIRTPDGTVLESTHRWDYRTYTDANGFTYMVDGGLEYARRNKGNYEELSVFHGDPHDKVREVFTWGTYGPKGDQELRRVLLKDMDTDHIEAIIKDGYLVSPLMENELTWRLTNEQQ